jgi:23S rRNA (cytidine1920-2'-O)/16S rRNA (cytidine1409-2'-O)-methyltransferase
VVRDWRLRAEAVLEVAAAAAELGLGVAGVTASPLPGPSGNVEFFVWFRRDAAPADRVEIERVVAAGPSGEVVSGAPEVSEGE